MSELIPSTLAIGLFVLVFTAVTMTVIQVVDESRVSVGHQEVRRSEQLNTIINAPEDRTEVQASSTVELIVRNTGNSRIGEFDQWDLTLETQQATTTAISYMTYTDNAQPKADEWTVLGIYNNASTTPRVAETFSPGILDPGESMVALLNPSPPVIGDTYDRATFVTPGGVTAKIIFKVLATPPFLYVVDAADATLYRYEKDGTLDGTETLNAANTEAYGVTTKGAGFWTTDLSGDIGYEYSASFSLNATWSQTPANQDGSGITTDNNNIWLSDLNDSVLYKYDMSGTFVSSFSLDSANTDSTGVTTDGTSIWIVDKGDYLVYKYDTVGAFLGTFALAAANQTPSGITTDGTNIWVVDAGDAKLYKYDMTGSLVSSFDLAEANADPRGITVTPR